MEITVQFLITKQIYFGWQLLKGPYLTTLYAGAEVPSCKQQISKQKTGKSVSSD